MSTWNPSVDVLLTDSEDEEESYKKDYRGREALLFIIDANLYEQRERFTSALDIIRKAFVSGLLVNDKDLLGVVFANTEMSPDPLEPDCLENISMPQNCAVFLPLRQLSKSIVEHLLRFLETAEKDFGQQYGVADNGGCGSYSSMLRMCLSLFENCGHKINNGTIVYLTDRETPHPTHTREYQLALQKAKHLEGKEMEFKVIPMVDSFDYDVFYKEFCCLVRDIELESFVVPDVQQEREILADRKLRQDFLKRSLGHFELTLGAGLTISMTYYNYFNNYCQPKRVKVLRKNNKIVKQHRRIMVRQHDEESGRFYDEQEVKASGGWSEIELGSMKIRISPQQLSRVRHLHPRGMMLLGFKPRSAMPENFYYKPCNFVCADDESIIGSRRLYRALWERCRARDKIAVCLFMRKRNSAPRYVALVPVAIADTESRGYTSLLKGDGFKIVYLPMAKHIRDIDFSEWNSAQNVASEECIDVFQKIIRKLRFDYQPNLISDPNIKRLQDNLLALALNIRSDDAEADCMPDTEAQDKRIAKLLPQLENLFSEDVEVAKKRTAKEPAAGGSAPKMAKASDADLERLEYVQQLVANKTLESCTIAQLRSILEQHFEVKMAKSAKKGDLVARIYDLNQ